MIDSRVWPERMLSLVRSFDSAEGEKARGEFWVLLNLAIVQRLRLLWRRHGPLDGDRLQDLASEKSLELIRRLDCGQWKPAESSPGELVNFLSAVARNALVDEVRRDNRRAPVLNDMVETAVDPTGGPGGATGHAVDRRDFVTQLVNCAGKLKPDHRFVWLLRVLYELPTRTIADHPEVRLRPGHVDVILARCRQQIRRCMTARGFDLREIPPGTFAELWWRFRAPDSGTEDRHA